MTRKAAFLPLIVVIAGAVPAALVAMPPAASWDIGPLVRGRNYSVGMPAHPLPGPDGSVGMEFPRAGDGEVDAPTTAVGPLAGLRRITLSYRIDAARGTRFVAVDTPDEPATVSLYFQQAGDNWSSKGRFASYRWYAPARAVIPITPGRHSVTISLNEAWTNVNGQPNHAAPAGYAAALENTATIGIAFGSASRRSHGVFATEPARFILLGLDLE